MVDPKYTPEAIYIVSYRFNVFSIYRVEIERETRKMWFPKALSVEAIAGEQRKLHLGASFHKGLHDWFIEYNDARRFVVDKLDNLLARMRANIEVLEGVREDVLRADID